ncbi:hypothetical protein [Cellulosilyticum ruminicola]|uniref:hypothetical protein n=1 Tax=Cellulosilyticum ruminicola TaxID=425254 RepID=UPI0006D14336|nr:hypothetical protein [Cellulosilyticum ruminicola]
MNKYIIIDADPFCFGPISTSLNIVRELKKEKADYQIVLLGINTTVQLAESTGLFDKIVACDTTKEEELIRNREIIEGAQLYISNTNAASINILNKHFPSVKKVFVDTLFWMWDKLYADFSSLEKYYIQNFYGIEEQLQKFKNNISSYEVVNPIVNIEVEKSPNKENIILVNLGGIENVYTGKTEFYHFFIEKLINVLKQHKINDTYKVYICGGGKTINELSEQYHDEGNNFYVGVLGQKEYLDKLSKCKYFLSMPGLTSFYESTFYRVNTYFLLPQNYSQYLQLCMYHEHDKNIKGMVWDDFEGCNEIKPFINEIDGIAIIKKYIKQFINDESNQRKFFDNVIEFLSSQEEEYIESSLAFNHSGAVDIAKGIIDILKKGDN